MKLSWLRSPFNSARRRRSLRRGLIGFESLESRQMLAITWVNQGTAQFDADQFNATFGGQAQAARAVVNQASSMWDTVLSGVNFSLTVVAAVPSNPNALASTSITEVDNFSAPIAATVSVNPNVNWFVDPTPADHSEFATILTPFAATGAVGGTDLLTTMLHEVGHAVGIADDPGLAIEGYVSTNTGVLDPLDNSPPFTTLLYGFQILGGIVFSTASGLHVFEQPFVQGNINYTGLPNDLMTRAVPQNTRRLISDLDVQIMDTYVTPIVLPSTLTEFNFFANSSAVTGVLTINGDLGANTSDDFILTKQGNSLHVRMNGSDMAFPFDQITAINVAGGQGSDRIQVLMSPGLPLPSDGNPIPPGATLNFTDNGPGSDTDQLLFIAAGSTSYEVDGTKVVRNGSPANYTVNGVEDLLTYSLGSADSSVRVDDTPAGIDKLIIYTAGGNDIIDIEAIGAGTTLELNTTDGSDTVFLSLLDADLDLLLGNLNLIASGGPNDDDLLYVYDQSNNTPSTYVITQTEIKRGALTIAHSGFEGVEIRTGDKVDNIFVQGLSVATEIDTGLGADTITVDSNGANPGGVVDPIDALLTVRAGVDAAVDTLILNDSGDSTGDILTVTETQIGVGPTDTFFGATGAVEYHEIEVLNILTGRDDDHVTVKSTDPGTVTTIDGTQGSDTMEVSSLDGPDMRTGNSNGIRSHLTLLGDGGNDVLLLDDTTDTTADQATITATEAGAAVGDNFFGPGGRVTYSSFVAMTMRSGEGSDRVNIQSTNHETSTTVLGGKGNDQFDIDSNTAGTPLGNVNAIVSALTINGQDGDDVVMLDGTGDFSPNLYTVSDTQIGAGGGDTLFGAGGMLTYSSLLALSVLNGAHAETVRVISSAAGTTTTLDTGAGDDQVHVDSNGFLPGGTVDGLKGPLVVHGGAGTSNTLTLDDMSDATGDVFAISSTHIGAEPGNTMFSGGHVQYDGIGTLNIIGSSGGNTISVHSTGAVTQLTAGFNADTIYVDSNGPSAGGTVDNIVHSLAITSGGGLDQLRLDDGDDATGDHVTISDTMVGFDVADTFFGPGGTLTYNNLAALVVNTGSMDDAIEIRSTKANTPLMIDSGGGFDRVVVTSNIGSVDDVRSLIVVHGGADAAEVLLADSADTTVDVVHVTPAAASSGSVGTAPGDNFFAAGGGLNYEDVSTVTLLMGNTAGDSILTAPSPTLGGTIFVFDGNNPTTAPGDTLTVDLSGVTDPVHGLSAPGAGEFTSGDHASISYTEIEDVQTASVAPAVMLTLSNSVDLTLVQVAQSGNLEVFNNGGRTAIFMAPLASVPKLIIDALDGDDMLSVAAPAGSTLFRMPIVYKGGAGANTVLIARGHAHVDALVPTGDRLDTIIESGATLTTNRLMQNRLSFAGPQGKVTILPGGETANVLESLDMDPAAMLDLTDNDLILRATAETKDVVHADVQARIITAQNGQDANYITNWNGAGITSSVARITNVASGFDLVGLGAIRNSDLDITTGLPGSSYASFGGEPVGPDDVLLKHTYNGDGNLDGFVSFDDYVGMDNAFFGLIPNLGWATGDINFDFAINFDDYTVVDQAYFFQAAPLAVGWSEPGEPHRVAESREVQHIFADPSLAPDFALGASASVNSRKKWAEPREAPSPISFADDGLATSHRKELRNLWDKALLGLLD